MCKFLSVLTIVLQVLPTLKAAEDDLKLLPPKRMVDTRAIIIIVPVEKFLMDFLPAEVLLSFIDIIARLNTIAIAIIMPAV